MKKTLSLLALSSALALGAAAPALANDVGPYGGIDLGITDLSGADSEVGFGAFLGYRINTNLAGEVALRRLGSFGGVDLNAFQISALGILPFNNQTSGYLRVGYGFNDADCGVGRRCSADDRAIFGFGLRHQLNRQLTLRGEYTSVAKDADQFNVGLEFKF
ncbi:hypothetical protein IP84_10190 [beta proteobacterium AAP99]|nr:hypothetical protein IP84_10190 [beta proteobacterium AAP99]